jgi:hypothetical protein
MKKNTPGQAADWEAGLSRGKQVLSRVRWDFGQALARLPEVGIGIPEVGSGIPEFRSEIPESGSHKLGSRTGSSPQASPYWW